MTASLSLSSVVELLGLTPLEPEGGLISLNYLSSQVVLAKNIQDEEQDHPLYSAIYYLLTTEVDSFSAFHRLPSDEIYHHYFGLPVDIYLLDQRGVMEVATLGDDIAAGQRPQICVPAFCWQASRVRQKLDPNIDYALLGTTMAPGYIDEDFELGQRNQLLQMFPHHAEVIIKLTR
jgi:predicted cupin superfamily sugar epimerase